MRVPNDPFRRVLPEYGNQTLADVLPSIGAHFDVPGAVDTLGLPDTRKYIILLVDGLGWFPFYDHQDEAPFLSHLGQMGSPIASPLPSTTAVSMASLGTGLPPGSHGIAGYTFRYRDQTLNALHFPKDVNGLDVQPQMTFVERLNSASATFFTVSQRRFENSGLTVASLRGSKFYSTDKNPSARRQADLALEAANSSECSVVFVYEGRLDKAGHVHGVGSNEWLQALGSADALAQMLYEGLPEDCSIIITADHGMLNIPKANRITVEDHPKLTDSVELLAGEGRFRHLYLEKGASQGVVKEVVNTWQKTLGDRASVVSKARAIEEKWFGDLSSQVADRFGDVLVACEQDYAVMTKEQPDEYNIVGMHGSRSAAEVLVPLFTGTYN